MTQLRSDDLRDLVEHRVTALRRRIDNLKALAVGQPLVTIDFIIDAEKLLDGWKMYKDALREERSAPDGSNLI